MAIARETIVKNGQVRCADETTKMIQACKEDGFMYCRS